MIQISFWAKKNKFEARLLLAVSYILLFIITVYVAILLDQIHFHLPFSIPCIAIVLMGATLIFYPQKRRRSDSHVGDYFRRKVYELIFLWSTLISICFLFNKNERAANFNTYQRLSGSFISTKENIKEVPGKSAFLSKKKVKKQFKELLKEIKKSRRVKGKGFLIVLVILGGIALSFLVLGLSCNISCSGNETLGTIVLFGGIAAVILLMFLLIRRINRSKRPAENEEVGPSQNLPFASF